MKHTPWNWAAAFLGAMLVVSSIGIVHAQEAEPSSEHVVVEVLGGLAGSAVGLAPLYGYLGTRDFDGTMSLAMLTMPLGVSFGVWGAGELAGGNGGFGWTFLGQALGGIASVPLAVAAFFGQFDFDEDGDEDGAGSLWALGVAGIVAFPVIGGVVGYELSNDSSASVDVIRRAPTFSARLGAAPLASGGGTVTLAGRF